VIFNVNFKTFLKFNKECICWGMNFIATSIVILIYYSKRLLRNAFCIFITETLTNISNICVLILWYFQAIETSDFKHAFYNAN